MIAIFDNPNPESVYRVSFKTKLTSVCPLTKKADVSDLVVEYIPGYVCAEVLSFEKYILSFAEIAIYHEALINQIFNTVGMTVQPRWLSVTIKAPMFSLMNGHPMTIELKRTSDDQAAQG